MNRSQLLNELAARNEWTRREADQFLTSFTDLITATVSTGEDVAISGFAKFRRIDRPARMARNPATGEQVRVAAKRVARITPLKAFKDAVLSGQEGAGEEGTGEEGRREEGSGQEDRREEGARQEEGSDQAPLSVRQSNLRSSPEDARAPCPGVFARTLGRVDDALVEVDLVRVRLPLVAPFRIGARRDRGQRGAARPRAHRRRASVGASAPRPRVRNTTARRSTVRASRCATTCSPARSPARDSTTRAVIAPRDAALECALLDARLRAENVSLATWLGAADTTVDRGRRRRPGRRPRRICGASSARTSPPATGASSARSNPVTTPTSLAAARAEVGPGVDLAADANGSYTLGGARRLFDTVDDLALATASSSPARPTRSRITFISSSR